MDRIDRDKQLEKFKGRISTIPLKDYTKPIIKSSEMNGLVHEEERAVKKEQFEPTGNRVNRYFWSYQGTTYIFRWKLILQMILDFFVRN